jgi:hypothetical protein
MLRASRSSIVAPLCVLAVLALAAPARTAQGQTNWGRYTPGTIAAIIQLHDSSIRADYSLERPHLVVSGADFPTVVQASYRGDSRPLDPRRLRVLRQWGLAFLRDTSVVQDFHREYLFQEGKRLLWLPVQDNVASYFARELQPGQLVSLYVIWAGAYYEGEDVIWTFLVNEFEASPAAQ